MWGAQTSAKFLRSGFPLRGDRRNQQRYGVEIEGHGKSSERDIDRSINH
jgi:hypothetical protein